MEVGLYIKFCNKNINYILPNSDLCPSMSAKGSCQVKKNQKIREKLELVRPIQLPPYPNFFFLTFGNIKPAKKKI